jgi:D-serine dehydratase
MTTHSAADSRFDWTFKGFAPQWSGLTASEIGASGLKLFDDELLMPAAVLKRSSIERNRAWMRKFLALTGAKLAPHGKTTLAPDLFRQQMEDGAWAITAATAHHARLYRQFGISRIFLANQLVGSANIRWVIEELKRDPEFDFYCLADSAANVAQLAESHAKHGGTRPLKVLVEAGRIGGRCGVRSVEEGLTVARVVAAHPAHLSLVGIETFEGISQAAPNGVELAQIMLDNAVALARACAAEHLFGTQKILLSAGGSAFFDLAAKMLRIAELAARSEVILRSGCYITHDDGLYGRLYETLRKRMPDVDGFGPPLEGALQVWAHVQSMPEPGRMVCAFGRRDVGSESNLPKPLWWARRGDSAARRIPADFAVTDLFDQHAILATPNAHNLQIGDMVGFGVSHPCTTFDKWRALLVVDDGYVVRDVVRTYF